MRIQSIEFSNFRRFLDEKVELNPGINIFVGPNNSGKTTILEAIGLVFGYPSSLGPFQLSKSIDTGTCEIEMLFTLHQEEWRKAFSLIRHGVERKAFETASSEETLDKLSNIPVRLDGLVLLHMGS